MLTALFVTARIVANPVSNVFQKRLTQVPANPIFIIAATHALLTLACLPMAAGRLTAELNGGFWVPISICAVLAVASNVLLVYALQSSDLSVLGPINAYKAVISLVLGVFLIGEVPTPMGATGVLLILAGSYFVVDGEGSRGSALSRLAMNRGVQLRFGALILSATEAVFLKKALLASSPMTAFVAWSMLGLPVAVGAAALLLRGRMSNEMVVLGSCWRTYFWLAATTGLMQSATLFTFGKLQVGYSLALFQLSAVISVLLGYRYFQERNIRRRLIGSAIMAAGAVLIVVHGRGG